MAEPMVDPNNLPEDWKGNPDGTPKVVTAAASMGGSGGLAVGRRMGRELVEKVEHAMSEAILDATERAPADKALHWDRPADMEELKRRQLAARQRVLDEHYQRGEFAPQKEEDKK